jgi:uncharacterized protein
MELAVMMRTRSLISLAIGIAATFSPAAAAALDCPLRDAPFSLDSPMMDVMMSEPAKDALVAASPAFGKLPERMASTTAPSFSAIMNVRRLAQMMRVPDSSFAALDAALRAVPVTAEDRRKRCERYDNEVPTLNVAASAPLKVLVFEKMTGFRDGPSVEAAKGMITELAARNGWALAVTDKGGAIAPATLRRFDLIVWNNVSGDVLTVTQRRNLKRWIEGGGGFLAVHGSGGDPTYFWDWYVDTLIGARFIGHTMNPQFQDARIEIQASPSGIGASLKPGWTMNDEWYSFAGSPRAPGTSVIATLDESSYTPTGIGGQDLRMTPDHPIAWTRCVGGGRSFYSAIGHRPETYADPQHRKLIEDAMLWAGGKGATRCRAGREVPAAR